MTDDEYTRLTEQVSEAERTLYDKDIELAEIQTRRKIESAAHYAGIEDTDAAYKLVDLAEIESDNPKTIAKAIQNLLKEKPYLKKVNPPTPGILKHRPGLPRVPMSTNDAWVRLLRSGLNK